MSVKDFAKGNLDIIPESVQLGTFPEYMTMVGNSQTTLSPTRHMCILITFLILDLKNHILPEVDIWKDQMLLQASSEISIPDSRSHFDFTYKVLSLSA